MNLWQLWEMNAICNRELGVMSTRKSNQTLNRNRIINFPNKILSYRKMVMGIVVKGGIASLSTLRNVQP